MLELQRYLREQGTPESLSEELGIGSYFHPSLPLVGFKYSQINSPKYHPIVRESRGVVLESGSWNLVAKPFHRFFNVGEDVEAYQAFDWSDFHCTTKEDGSLIILYHYDGEWHANTSGSFGLGEVGNGSSRTWRDLFWGSAELCGPELRENYVYIFELCSPLNKVIRLYPKPVAYLLSIFRLSGDEHDEFSPEAVDMEARMIETPRPERHRFQSHAEITAFLEAKSQTDKTFEGVVIRDRYGVRFKIKSESYLRLHHLHDNGNIFNPKRLIPIVLAGEQAEVVSYFPEVQEFLKAVEDDLEKEFAELTELWQRTWKAESQKDFALSIVKATPYSGILFTLRKIHGMIQTENLLREQWNRSEDVILKRYAERGVKEI